MREAKEVECFRPSQPSFLAPLFRVTSKFYQPRFLRMKRQPEFGKAFPHRFQKSLRFSASGQVSDDVRPTRRLMPVELSTAALRDLEGIGDYIAQDNPRRAKSFMGVPYYYFRLFLRR